MRYENTLWVARTRYATREKVTRDIRYANGHRSAKKKLEGVLSLGTRLGRSSEIWPVDILMEKRDHIPPCSGVWCAVCVCVCTYECESECESVSECLKQGG